MHTKLLIILLVVSAGGCSASLDRRLLSMVNSTAPSQKQMFEQNVAEFRTSEPAIQSQIKGKLVGELRSSDSNTRMLAAKVLKRIGAEDEDIIPGLIGLLSDSRQESRGLAAEMLGNFGPDAEIAVPELVQSLGDASPYVRNIAAKALGDIGPKAESAVPVLVQRLSDTDSNVRVISAKALGNIGPNAKNAAPELIKMLRAEPKEILSFNVRGSESLAAAAAAEALIKIGPDAIKEVVPNVADQLINIDNKNSRKVLETMPLDIPVSELTKALSDYNDCKWAVDSLLAKGARIAVPALVNELMRHIGPAGYCNHEALKALYNTADISPEYIPEIAKLLKSSSYEVQYSARRFLENMGAKGEDAIKAYVERSRKAEKKYWASWTRRLPGLRKKIKIVLSLQHAESCRYGGAPYLYFGGTIEERNVLAKLDHNCGEGIPDQDHTLFCCKR